jgi:hypothetical protein
VDTNRTKINKDKQHAIPCFKKRKQSLYLILCRKNRFRENLEMKAGFRAKPAYEIKYLLIDSLVQGTKDAMASD